MSLVLEYARPQRVYRWSDVPSSIAITLFTSVHLHLCWQISRVTLVPICKRLGQHFVAWTPMAWVPGCILTSSTTPLLGTLMILLNSLLAGCLLQDVLCRYQDRIPGGATTLLRDWRLQLALLLWCAWIPVPSTFCFMYQFGLWANHL